VVTMKPLRSTDRAELILDLDTTSVRDANSVLRSLPAGSRATLRAPRGRHNLAVGLNAPIAVTVDGSAGYYVGGLGKHADITVNGPAGWGVGENLMSGSVVVHGDASQSAAATAHGGSIVVHGDASLRAAISLKGGTLAVAGNVGAFCGFMAQAGTVLVGGSAGDNLGDSLYEAVIYVAGSIASLGTDAQIEELTAADVATVRELIALSGFDHVSAEDVTRVASAKQLYHFTTHAAGSY
jgi:methylamine---glutamate N-methyltransferase subunit B